MKKIQEEIRRRHPHARIERFSRRERKRIVRTGVVKINFAGDWIPESVIVRRVVHRVSKYYRAPPQCKRCWSYKHGTSKCNPAATICKDCSEEHTSERCEGGKKCCNCGGEYSSNSKDCFVYQKEQEILYLADHYYISIREVRQRHMDNPMNTYRQDQLAETYSGATKYLNDPKKRKRADEHAIVERQSDEASGSLIMQLIGRFDRMMGVVEATLQQNQVLAQQNQQILDFLGRGQVNARPPGTHGEQNMLQDR